MSNNTDATEGGRAALGPLAAHIAAVMNNPATPAEIYNALLDALGELQGDRMKRPTASFIAAVLAHEQEQPDNEARQVPPAGMSDRAREIARSAAEVRLFKPITLERAKALVDFIIPAGAENETASLMIELIGGLACIETWAARGSIADILAEHLYAQTEEFSTAADRYVRRVFKG